MLVLQRQTDDCIYIGDDIIITVIETRSNYARIGVTAPPNIVVLRGELRRAIAAGKMPAPHGRRIGGENR